MPGAKPPGPTGGPTVQVFGAPDSQPTRAALRFFRERRIDVHFVDIRRKPMAPAELRRFIDRLGARAVADESSKAWRDAGLGYMRLDDAELTERLLSDQRLLNIPLVRVHNAVAAGRDEATWKSLVPSR
jgi:arsenate reductase-like glutaredoxin family protein